MKSSIVVGRGWAGAKLHSDEFRNLWIDAITADIRMRRQLRGLVRAEIRWLYAEVPKLDRQTDNTGWLVIADWLQERDGEAVAVAIREVIAAVEQTA